jgi:hypothetical protein
MVAAGVAEIGELLDCTGYLNCTVGPYIARQYARRIYANMALLSPARQQPSERSFGFEYEYEGKRYAFHIVAASQEEAEGRLAALIHAQFIGELHQA